MKIAINVTRTGHGRDPKVVVVEGDLEEVRTKIEDIRYFAEKYMWHWAEVVLRLQEELNGTCRRGVGEVPAEAYIELYERRRWVMEERPA